jgi:Tfp pilus assembly protein PilZ
MQILKKIIHDPTELRRWFPTELQAGFLFLPGETRVSVGEEVLIWVTLPPYHAELYLAGMVAWRRSQAGGKRVSLAAGTGVSLSGGQDRELRFLARLLTGEVRPLPIRVHPRTPLVSPWNCHVIVPHLQQWSTASINNISPGGAEVTASELELHEGCLIQLGFRWHSGTTHHMELAWYRTSGGQVRLGLRRLPTEAIPDQEWEQLVGFALNHFQSLILDL